MQEGEGIRKSPYEEGLYFVRPEQGTTLQDHSTQWQASLEAPAPGTQDCCIKPRGQSLPLSPLQIPDDVRSLPKCASPADASRHLRWPLPTFHSLRSPPNHPGCLLHPQVGARYSLLKILGYGSYSAVCLAMDHTTGEKVRRGGLCILGVGGWGKVGIWP